MITMKNYLVDIQCDVKNVQNYLGMTATFGVFFTSIYIRNEIVNL